jgi:hypothetical protein
MPKLSARWRLTRSRPCLQGLDPETRPLWQEVQGLLNW